MEIYVVRHTPVAAEAGLCYGQTDIAVSSDFPLYLKAISRALPLHFDAIFSSPLQRCTQLATALNRGSYTTDARLQELHFGEWENQFWSKLDRQQTEAWTSDIVHARPPAGESMLNLSQRVNAFLTDLYTMPHQRVLLCTHAGVIRCLLAEFNAITLEETFAIQVDYGAVFQFKQLV